MPHTKNTVQRKKHLNQAPHPEIRSHILVEFTLDEVLLMKTSPNVQVRAEVCAYTKTELSTHTGLLTYNTWRENAYIKYISAHHSVFFFLFVFPETS